GRVATWRSSVQRVRPRFGRRTDVQSVHAKFRATALLCVPCWRALAARAINKEVFSMHAGRPGSRAVTPVAVLCAVVFLFLAVVAPANADVIPQLQIDPPDHIVAGDTVTAEGPVTECVSNKTPTYTFTFSTGGHTVASGTGSGIPGSVGVEYSA